MLARKRTPVLQHQVGHLPCDRLEALHPLRALQIDDRTNVQQPDRCMRIEAGLRIVLRQNPLEILDIIVQALRRHRRILDERDRLGVPGLRHRQPQRGAAQFPDTRLLLSLYCPINGVTQPVRFQVCLQAPNLVLQLFARLAEKLNQQHRPRVALDEPPQRRVLDPAARLVQHESVYQLHRRRTVFQDYRRSPHRLQQFGKLHAAQGAARWQRYQPHLCRHRQGQRTFGADQNPRQIERFSGPPILFHRRELVQIVPAHSAQ